jgi:hypothetical protein
MKRLLDSLRNGLSFKELLVSRAYTSSALDALSTEVAEDTSYTLVGSLEEPYRLLDCFTHPFDHSQLSGCFMQHSLVLGVILLCYLNYHYGLIQRDKSIIQRLEPFVPPYDVIRKRTRTLLFMIFFIFFRNVENAI